MSGKLIVFEGIDGAGKSSQLLSVADWLKDLGYSVLSTKEPGGSSLGSSIRNLLLSIDSGDISARAELLLYAADRAQHIDMVIKPAIERGDIVLCDRFTFSTIAYQGYGRGIDLSLINSLNDIATGGIVPDLVLWFDVSPYLAMERTKSSGKLDRIESESLEFFRKVYQGYYRQYLNRGDLNMVRIYADYPEAVVSLMTKQVVEEFIHKNKTPEEVFISINKHY